MRTRVAFLTITMAVLCTGNVLSRQIEVWGMQNLGAKHTKWWQEELLPKFTARTGITVVYKDMSGAKENAYAQLLSGKGPDILYGVEGEQQYSLTITLDRFVAQANSLRQIPPTLMGRNPSTRAVHATPLGIVLTGMLYDKGTFTESGLDPVTPPADWDQLEQLASKLRRMLDGGYVRQGFDVDWGLSVFEGFLLQNGGVIASEDQKRSGLGTPEAEFTLAYLSRLYRIANPPGERTTLLQLTDLMNAFPNRIAITWSSQLLIRLGIRSGKEIGFFPGRRCETCRPTTIAGPYGMLAIARSSKDPSTAWSLIEWLLAPEANGLYNSQMGLLPVRADMDDWVKRTQPYLLDCYRALQYARLSTVDVDSTSGYLLSPGGPFAGGKQASGMLSPTLLQALRGEVDPSVALVEAHSGYQKYLDQKWKRK